MRYAIDSFRAEQAYHHTACLVLLKAVSEVYGGKKDAKIGNSLNQGFFVYIGDTDSEMTDSEIKSIDKHMKAIVDADMPIEKEIMTNAEAAAIWREKGMKKKAELFGQADPEEKVEVCVLGGYHEYFYGDVLPSTGLLEMYEIRKYRNGLLLRLPNALGPDIIPAYRDDDKLYTAFADTKKIRKSGIDYLADLNKVILDGDAAQLITDAEETQEKEIDAIAERAAEENRRLILIAGPSSSGKTTFAHKLCAAIEARTGVAPMYLGTDDYFVERAETPLGADGEPDYEGLEALDLKLFNEQMADLLAGKEVDAPEYDFVEGKKKFGVRTIKAAADQMIVIEGIHSLNDTLTSSIPAEDKFKIYISPLTKIGVDRHNRLSTSDARMLRRMVRDNQFRGTDASGTLKNWSKVRAGENVNIFPYSSSADCVFNTSLVYETAMLKGFAAPLLEEIKEDSPVYPEAQRMLEFLRYFKVIEDTSAVPEGALLREFIGQEQ